MELHNLKPAAGSVKNAKRVGRGQGSGRGGTSTRGHKGAKSRSGYSKKRAFEGGQMPIQMRLPKRGFKNPFRVAYVAVNLDQLQVLAERHNVSAIDYNFLVEKRIVKKTELVKILGRGELTTALQVSTHASSESAKAAIEKAGGSFTKI